MVIASLRHRVIFSLSAGVLALGVVAPPPASAQYVMVDVIAATVANAGGNARHDCLMGAPRSEKKILKARGYAMQAMQLYFEAMQSGAAPRSSFFVLDEESRWDDGEQTVGEEEIDLPTDFLARADATLMVKPQEFVRGGLGSNGQGRWQVLGADGRPIGSYTAFLVRKSGQWKIRHLALVRHGEEAENITQYCAEPGDVMPYRLRNAAYIVDYREGRVEKARAMIAEYQAELAQAEAVLADNPKNRTARKSAKGARNDIERWQKKLAKRQADLEIVLEDQREVMAEARAAGVSVDDES